MKTFIQKTLTLNSRIYLGLAALLLGLTLVGPLWSTRLVSPQYHGEEALHAVVYAGGLRGNLQEIRTLNQYLGVRFPEDIPELRYTPWVLGGLLGLCLLALALSGKPRQMAAVFLAVCMAVAALAAGERLQQRLYTMGHERGKSIIARAQDFTPPMIGWKKIANFEVTALPGWGAWAYFLALGLAGWAGLRPPSPSLRAHQPSRLVPKKNGPIQVLKAG